MDKKYQEMRAQNNELFKKKMMHSHAEKKWRIQSADSLYQSKLNRHTFTGIITC
jgi:hypothetical protein